VRIYLEFYRTTAEVFATAARMTASGEGEVGLFVAGAGGRTFLYRVKAVDYKIGGNRTRANLSANVIHSHLQGNYSLLRIPSVIPMLTVNVNGTTIQHMVKGEDVAVLSLAPRNVELIEVTALAFGYERQDVPGIMDYLDPAKEPKSAVYKSSGTLNRASGVVEEPADQSSLQSSSGTRTRELLGI
jgi:hypothetical protein